MNHSNRLAEDKKACNSSRRVGEAWHFIQNCGCDSLREMNC